MTGGEIDDLEDLFENAPCGYLSTDKDSRIGKANQTFARWTGYPAASLVGSRFPDLLTAAGRIFYETHFAPSLLMQGELNEIALDIVCADGTKMPVLVNAVERRSGPTGPEFFRITIFNATERRRYEQQLLEARNAALAEALVERDASELREQFIAILGHDLRNPLAAISSGVKLLEKETSSLRGKRIAKLMEGSVIRARGLIDNVLDFARGRLGGGLTLRRDADEPLEPMLRQVVEELRSISPNRDIVAEYRIGEPVNCDRGRIGQLVSNLLGNAITYGAPDQAITLIAATEAGDLEISIANGGEPISPEAQERLFQPFFRGESGPRREGLGLGLHIASEIAKAHGGRLTVASNAVETRFTFTMPVGQGPEVAPEN
jgi:sigma-B regulation protein RsbU (phosphoserine phosphatase)